MRTNLTTPTRRGVMSALATGPAVLAAARSTVADAARVATSPMNAAAASVRYRRQKVGDVDLFYREAGPVDAPVILLLHGFPTASHMFRDLIPQLADRFRVIAPDLPGFGQTKAPPRGTFAYTFDALATVVGGFVEALGLTRYALYIFDYGAPVALRLAMRHPERVSAIVSQNGNAYVEGFSDQWGPWEAYWRDPSASNREACRSSLAPVPIRSDYHPTATSSTSPIWRDRVRTRSSST